MSSDSPFTREAALKREIRRHLKSVGFKRATNGELIPPEENKDAYRDAHRLQRSENLLKNMEFLKKNWRQHQRVFANGEEVEPGRISPRLIPVVRESRESEIFRLAACTWSVPVSQGYGRRMRFLVWDDSNDRLIGIIGLTDPVFNLKARDTWIGWDASHRKKRLVCVMDAFVLGAVPPYNMLLCGKMLAALLTSSEIREHFKTKYSKTRGIISQEKKKAVLAMVTVTSALGRSSVYNRVKIADIRYLHSVGYTTGWGHFHLPDRIFSQIREFLAKKGHSYSDAHKFGQGPNWRLRAIRAGLTLLGINPSILRHGLHREVFVCPLLSNLKDFLTGQAKMPKFSSADSAAEIGRLARERWCIPRAIAFPEYRTWNRDSILGSLETHTPSNCKVDISA
jgi:hypothetical protein